MNKQEIETDLQNFLSNFWYVYRQAEEGCKLYPKEATDYGIWFKEMQSKYEFGIKKSTYKDGEDGVHNLLYEIFILGANTLFQSIFSNKGYKETIINNAKDAKVDIENMANKFGFDWKDFDKYFDDDKE